MIQNGIVRTQSLYRMYIQRKRYLKVGSIVILLNVPIATKVVCLSRLLECLRSLYDKQCGPRSDCSVLGPHRLLLYLIRQ